MSAERIIGIDFGTTITVAYLEAGIVNYIAQSSLNTQFTKELSELRIEDYMVSLQQIKTAAENRFGITITESIISVPNHYTPVEISKLKSAAALLGFRVLRIITRAEALIFAFVYRQKPESANVLAVLNSPGLIDVCLANCSDTVIQKEFVKSYSDSEEIDVGNFSDFIIDESDELTICLCDSYSDNTLLEKLKDYRIVSLGEHCVVEGLCLYSTFNQSASHINILLLTALTYSFSIQANSTELLLYKKDTNIPICQLIEYNMPTAPVTVSIVCTENSFCSQNVLIEQFLLPASCCGKDIEVEYNIDANSDVELLFRIPRTENSGSGKLLYRKKSVNHYQCKNIKEAFSCPRNA